MQSKFLKFCETVKLDESEPESGEHPSDSENDRGGSESSTSKSDFDDGKAQGIFNDWVISLPALQRKTSAVLLIQSFRTRQ